MLSGFWFGKINQTHGMPVPAITHKFPANQGEFAGKIHAHGRPGFSGRDCRFNVSFFIHIAVSTYQHVFLL